MEVNKQFIMQIIMQDILKENLKVLSNDNLFWKILNPIHYNYNFQLNLYSQLMPILAFQTLFGCQKINPPTPTPGKFKYIGRRK